MCSMKTDAMKSRLITSTGTGPLSQQQQQQKKDKLIKHAHVRSKSHHFSVTPKSLRGTADFIDALRREERKKRKKKEGPSSLKEGC